MNKKQRGELDMWFKKRALFTSVEYVPMIGDREIGVSSEYSVEEALGKTFRWHTDHNLGFSFASIDWTPEEE